MRRFNLEKLKNLKTETWLWDALAIALIICAFSWICYRNLSQPGPYGDESWAAVPAARFVQGATVIDPTPHHEFYLFGRTFPYMPNDYNGPIAGYIISGFFYLFGISVVVMRVATSIVGLLGVLATYLLVRRVLGRPAAFMTSLLVATDLTYVLAVRHDWGVISFGLLARMLALFFFLTWWSSRDRLRYLFFSLLMLGIALTYRFDYLSFVVGAMASMVLFYLFWLRPRVRVKELAVAVTGFLLGAFPILLYNILTGGRTWKEGRAIAAGRGLSPLPTSLEQLGPFLRAWPNQAGGKVKDLLMLTEGTYVPAWILGENFETHFLFGIPLMPWAVKIAAALLLLLLLVPQFRQNLRPLGFVITVFVLTLLFIAATPIATGPHHNLSLYPLPHLLVGVALAGIWQIGTDGPAWLKWLGRAVATAGLALLLASNLVLAQKFHERLVTSGAKGYWSESIYGLAEALKSDPEYHRKTLVLLDWGFEQPLIVLGQTKFRLNTPFWRILSEESPGPWLNSLIRDPNNLFAIRAEKFAWNPVIHKRFKDAYQKQSDLIVEEDKFFQRNGEHSFSVLRFSVPQATDPKASK